MNTPRQPTTHRKRCEPARQVPVKAAAATALLVLGLTGAALAAQQLPATPDPLTQRTIQITPTTESGSQSEVIATHPAAPVQPAAAPPLALLYPGADAVVAVLPLTPNSQDLSNGQVEPPQTKDGYWLTNYGKPGTGSTDTTYVIGHRWIAEDAPFNRIGTKARPGDSFTVQTETGTLDYTITSVETYNKRTLNTAPIWNRVPGRVVLITCDLKDPWGKNTTITAEPVSKNP